MTDYLEAARDRLGGLHDHLSRREVALAADDLDAILSAILDHLEEQQTDASIKHGLADVAAGRTEYLGRFADDEPDPLDESNHADRLDVDGGRWVWCDGCDGFRRVEYHSLCRPGAGWPAAELDGDYGPLTFASRPAEPPATAPQPDEAHGDTPDPARPAETHTAPEAYDVRLMTERPYKPQPWRLTEYYPEAYARFMDVLNVGVLPDWNDHDRHEAEFLADLAAHDAELREQIAAEIETDPKSTFLAGRAETSLTSHELAICVGMRRAARVARGEKP